MLGAKSPTLCYKYASGFGAKTNTAKDMPASLVNTENDIQLRVVETAKQRQAVSATFISELWKKLGTQLAVKGFGGDQLKLLYGDSVDPSRYGEYCQASATFFREIARLPQREAGILMRSVLADK
jgi:hypothetical protein